MHFFELIDLKDYHEKGPFAGRPLIRKEIISSAIEMPYNSTESLETLGAIVALLQDQIYTRIRIPASATITTQDVYFLYKAYTLLNKKLGLGLESLWFTTWEDLDFQTPEEDQYNTRDQIARDVASKLTPITGAIKDATERAWGEGLYQSVDPDSEVGWPSVQAAMLSLRKAFGSAQNQHEYRGVGNLSVGVIDSLSDVIWATGNYTMPANVRDDDEAVKNRLGQVVEEEFPGNSKEKAQKLIFAAYDYAQSVKHNRSATRADARAVADAALFIAELLWQAVGNPDTSKEYASDLRDVPF